MLIPRKVLVSSCDKRKGEDRTEVKRLREGIVLKRMPRRMDKKAVVHIHNGILLSY